MTVVVDIPCPRCNQSESVRKQSIGTYRCAECGFEFGPEDLNL